MLRFRIKNEYTNLIEEYIVPESTTMVVAGYKMVLNCHLYCHLLMSDGTTQLLHSAGTPVNPIGKQLNFVSWVKIPDIHTQDTIIDLNCDIADVYTRDVQPGIDALERLLGIASGTINGGINENRTING